MSKSHTDSDMVEVSYTQEEAAAIAEAIADAIEGSDIGDGAGHLVEVDAVVRWNGSVHRKNGGLRKTTLGVNAGKLDLRKTVEAVRAAEAFRKGAGTQRLKSYRATGWRAQYRQLSKTKAGRDLLAAAGVAPTARTAGRWQAGEQTARSSTRRQIASAYESAATRPARESAQDRVGSDQRIAAAFTEAVSGAYGGSARVKLTDIQRMTIK